MTENKFSYKRGVEVLMKEDSGKKSNKVRMAIKRNKER